jgi:hypothetical protein
MFKNTSFFKPTVEEEVVDHIYVDKDSGKVVYSKWEAFTPESYEQQLIANTNLKR